MRGTVGGFALRYPYFVHKNERRAQQDGLASDHCPVTSVHSAGLGAEAGWWNGIRDP